jgi:hypothetical protein
MKKRLKFTNRTIHNWKSEPNVWSIDQQEKARSKDAGVILS